MARWLVVAHDTAISTELIEALHERAAADPDASFFLLVPARQSRGLLTSREREPLEEACRRAEQAWLTLEDAGLPLEGAAAGDGSPLSAIAQEVLSHPGLYDALLISTHPPGISRWLKLDIVNQAHNLTDLPVDHVYPGQRASLQDIESRPAACRHEEMSPYWDGEANELAHRCTSCDERFPLGSLPERWPVWRP